MRSSNPRKKLLLILIIIISISIIGGLIYYYSKVPGAPIMRLKYKGEAYNGQEGSNCWPWGILGKRCVDKSFPPNLSNSFSVTNGEILRVETEAHKKPIQLGAIIRAVDFNTKELTFQKEIELPPDFKTEFKIDFPPGQYFVTVFGQWDEGDISYVFKIEVN